jgi:hypothetical protein
VPGAAGTTPFDLNDAGTIVGIYSDEPLHRTEKVRSFLRDRRGRYTTIGVPGATQTQARGINNRGQIAIIAPNPPPTDPPPMGRMA